MNIAFSQDHFSFTTHKFGLSVDFDYQKKLLSFVPISMHIGGSSNDSELALKLSFYFHRNSVKVNIKEFSISINNLTVHDSLGSADKSYLTSVLRGPLESLISFGLSKYLRGSMEDKMNLQIKNVSGLLFFESIPIIMDYNPIRAPKINPEYLVTYLNGTFYDKASQSTLNQTHRFVDYPEFNESSEKNLQIFISEYVMNSAAYATWKSRYMNVTFDSSRFPENAGFKLNVGILKQFVSEVSNLYDDHIELLMNIAVNEPPLIVLNENDARMTIRTSLTFYIINDYGLIKNSICRKHTRNSYHSNDFSI